MPEGVGYLPSTRRHITPEKAEEMSAEQKKKIEAEKKKKKAAEKAKLAKDAPPASAATVRRNKELAKDKTNPTFGMTGAEAAAYFQKKRKAGINPQ